MRILGCLLLSAFVAQAQERPLPPPNRTPILRLTQNHSTAPVTALAFSSDSATLFVGGLDKLVRAYSLKTGDAETPLRLPIGPGNAGAVNAVAVSPDGKWVAVAGRSPMRREAAFGQDGVVIDPRALAEAMRRDLGVIYVFDRTNPNRGKLLRGHQGEVRSLAFADPSPTDGPVVISAATERDATGKATGVVRTWDVATAKELAVRSGLPATPTRPGLAAWPLGGGQKAVRVAVSWPEETPNTAGVLRVWDTVTDDVRTHPDGQNNLPLSVRRDRDGAATAIVSGGFANRAGRIVVRPLDGKAEREILFPLTDGVFYLPLAVAAVGDSVVTLLETTAKPARVGERSAELRLIGPDNGTVRRVVLSDLSAAKLPVLMASRDGKFVAVGGFLDHRVEVFDVAALTAGREARQVIAGVNGAFTAVSFLDGNKLWAGEVDQTPTRGGQVFDFVARRNTANDGTNKLDTATTTAEFAFDTKSVPATVVMTLGGQRTVCTLRGAERPTVAVYSKDRRSVIAVAHTEAANAVTLVTLFDGVTGRRLRQLVGPEQPIRALSFSASRPLLAAVGGDRTVSVWSLADLDKQTGAIEGLQVTDNGTEVTVLSVAADAPAETRKLAAGDVIEGFAAADGKLDLVKSGVDFVWAIRSRPVGGTATIRVKGKPALSLPVGRAVEQRGPLFSLWLAPLGKVANPDWVGWSPSGPYDASSPTAEARIGWLSSTGDPAHPITFDGADQHRKTYYRKDVLRFLAEKAELSSAIDAHTETYPPPVPRLTLQVVAAGVVLRDAKATLRVKFDDVSDDYPLDQAVLKWRITAPGEKGGTWRTVALAGQDRTVSIDLSEHRWGRGHHTIEATLHKTPASPPGVSAVTEVPFAPAAPKLTVLANGKAAMPTITTEADALPLAAKVELANGEADVKLTWTDPTGERGTATLPTELKLKPGRTTVRVTATTRGAGEFDKLESDEVEVGVDFTPPKVVVPPRMSRLMLNTVTEPGLVGDRPVQITSAAKVRLSTVIASADPITAVEWDDGDGKWVPASLDAKGTASREATLTPGRAKTIRVRAKTERSEFATDVADVIYYPALPTMRYTRLPDSVANPALVVEGTYPATDAAFRATVIVASAEGRSRQFDAVVDPQTATWKAAVLLEPGENRLGFLLRNEWRAETRRNLAMISLRRPPRVLSVNPVDAGEGGVADVVAFVATDDGVAPSALMVNGRVTETKSRRIAPLPGLACWELTASAVPVTGVGKPDAITVAVRNADGDSASQTVAVKRKVVPLRPPVIALADGVQDRTTDRPRTSIAFKVSSQTALTRVEVWHVGRAGGEFEKVASVDPTTATAVADGFTLSAAADVGLRSGVNRVRVVAVNSGGETSATVAISYTSPGALVAIDGVDEPGVIGATRALARKGDEFEESVGGFVIVRGRVSWPTDEDVARNPGLFAVLFVNHIGHQPVRLDPVKDRPTEFTFRAPIFLNASNSKIRVELHVPSRDGALPQQAASETGFRIKCQAPITQQRLHVVVIGVDLPPSERFTLAKLVVKTLGGTIPAERTQFDRGEFQVGAFSQAVLYPLVVGEVTDGHIASALDEVSHELKRLSSGSADKWLNDMVLVYYQGKDWIGPDGRRWLHTSLSLRYPEKVADRFAVRLEGLPSTSGVRLTLLNVANPGQALDPLAAGPPLLRYGWKEVAATERLFPLLEKAIAARRSLGDIVNDVRVRIATDPSMASEPLEVIPLELRDRPIGAGSK